MSAELNIQLDQVNDRVEAGMEWLDVQVPDWFLDINVYALDLGDGDRCVLGQLARSKALADRVGEYSWRFALGGMNGYTKLSTMLDLGWDQTRDYGFLGSDLLCGEEYVAYTQALEARWFLAVLARQRQRLLPGMGQAELVSR